MLWKSKSWVLIGVLLAALGAMQAATAQMPTTQIADTIYHADGTAAAGTVLISWPAFTTSSGESVPSGSVSAQIAAGGALSVQLVPNAGATPMGSYYTVVYHLDDGRVSRQYWVVPQSTAPVKVSAIESTVLPASVAMQTVSKSYVDTAIATAMTGHPLDSTPLVLKAGDTMTGPLTLPADPVSAMQAANKNYVDTSIAAVAGGLGPKISLGGDIGGTTAAPRITAIQGQPVSATPPATGQILMWNGSAYAPATPNDEDLDSPGPIGDVAPAPAIHTNQLNAATTGGVASYVAGNNCQQDTWHLFCNSLTSVFTTPPSPQGSGEQDSQVINQVVSGPGKDVGNGVNGDGGWSTAKVHSTTDTVSRRGINQHESRTILDNAIGDFANEYTYIYGVGGMMASSDESMLGTGYGFIEPAYFKGTVASGAVNQTAPLLNGTGDFIDGAILIDTAQGTLSGSFAGGPSRVAGIPAVWSTPVSGVTLPLTTAVATCQANGGGDIAPQTTRPFPVTVTLTCTNLPIPGHGTPALAGSAYTWVTGNYPEQAKVLSVVSQSGTTQVITIALANPHLASQTTLWQGPLVGQFCSVDDDLAYSGQRPVFDVYGSLTGTDLIHGVRQGGALGQMPRPGGDTFESTTSAFHCYPGAEVVQNAAFTGYATTGSNILTGVSSTAGLTVGEPVSSQFIPAVYFFPYGTVITAIGANTVTVSSNSIGTTPPGQPMFWSAGIQLEPHSWTMAAGDTVEIPHPANVQLESAFRASVNWNTPGSGSTASRAIELGLLGTHIGSSFTPLHVSNGNPFSVYAHGLYAPAGAERFDGPWSSIRTIANAPVCGNPYQVACTVDNVEDARLPVSGTTNGTTLVTSAQLINPNGSLAANLAGVVVGSGVIGADIPAGTTIAAVSANTITLSQAATGSHAGETLQIAPPFQMWALPMVAWDGSDLPAAVHVTYYPMTGRLDLPASTTLNGASACLNGTYCSFASNMFMDSINGGAFHAGNYLGTPGVSGGDVTFGQGSANTHFLGANLYFHNSLVLLGGGHGVVFDPTNTGLWSSSHGIVSVGTGAPGDDSGTVDAAGYIGPATAPSGACSMSGQWVFSQDGHATFCAAGTWLTKL